jgi:prepilin-type processing-associated H-X9-DG protein
MKSKTALTKKDVVIVLACAFFLLVNLGAIGAGGRRRAKETLCLSNLKQWGTIIYLYLQDNNWVLPPEVGGSYNWLGVSGPYIQDDKIWLCPSATKTMNEGAKQPFAANTQRTGYKGSYGFHDWVTSDVRDYYPDPEWNAKLWMTSQVREASRVPVIADCARLYLVNPMHSDEPPAYPEDVICGEGVAAGEMKRYSVNRHNGAINGAFLDFSARKIGLKELWEVDWHRNWNPDNDPPPAWPAWMQNFKDYYETN